MLVVLTTTPDDHVNLQSLLVVVTEYVVERPLTEISYLTLWAERAR